MALPAKSELPLMARMLLDRWRKESLELITQLEESGQLLAMLEQANESTIDLLYELTIHQKKDYRAALEAAMEWSAPAPPKIH